jgi:hypothetical protein
MDESNFRPVMNEFARVENFCCTDYTLWGAAAPSDCSSNPPPECTAEPNAYSDDGSAATRGSPFAHERPTSAVSRDAFYLVASGQVVGRQKSFGDGVFFEDPLDGTRLPLTLNFDGITRALGIFLMHEPGLFPNPNEADLAAVRRGKALFESPETACALCHPAPTFAVSSEVNPAGIPLVMGPVVTPVRAEDGTNLDLLAEGFLQTFPQAQMESCEEVCEGQPCEGDIDACNRVRNVRFGVPSLRGIWDRADAFLHDGRARNLREVLCTPGHPALKEGEVGFNEVDGIPDTHGGTSHLGPAEIADLIAYLLTL